MRTGDHVVRHPGVVVVVEDLVADHDVPAAGPVLELLDIRQQPAVGGVEGVVGVPVALDQRVAQEQVSRHDRVDGAVGDRPADHQRHAVQRHALEGDDTGPLLLPVRFAVGALDQVRADPLCPLRLDPPEHPGVEPARLDQLRGHHQLRRLLVERRAGRDGEAGAPGAEVVLAGGVATADVRQQPGEQGLRDQGGVSRRLIGRQVQLAHRTAQLAVQVLPLADPQVVEELALAQPAKSAAGQLCLLLLHVAPQVQPTQ